MLQQCFKIYFINISIVIITYIEQIINKIFYQVFF